MLVLSGIVLVTNTILSFVVGVRLLRADGTGRAWSRPERLLALYFLLGAFVGNVTSSVAYMGWSDPALGIPLGVTTLLNAICLLGATAGAAGVYLFTAHTFHGEGDAHARTAGAVAWTAILAMSAAWVAQAVVEGFEIRVVVGPIHWFGFSLRALSFVWAAAESLRYYAASRRRLRLGLADAVVTNRFLLWGVWSIATCLLVSSELIARVFYLVTTGDAAESAETVANVAQPMIVLTIAITAVLGSISASMLFLTFFPTRWFRAWLERRGAGAPAAA